MSAMSKEQEVSIRRAMYHLQQLLDHYGDFVQSTGDHMREVARELTEGSWKADEK